MAPGRRGPGPARTRLGSRATAALVAQGLTAGGSLLLQVLAARSLGASGYGHFTLLLAVLLLFTTLQTGWVGDSLTVLDRTSPTIRGALAWSMGGFAVTGAVGSATLAVVLGATSVAGGVLFGCLTALWIVEDAARRTLMARLEFWALVVNDLVYASVAVGGVALWLASGGRATLYVFLAAMSGGAFAAVVVACIQLPREERSGGPLTRSGMRSVATFAVWRSAHLSLQPLVTLCIRTAVAGIAGASVLGRLEAARLMIAPVTTLRHGLGTVILPAFAARERRGEVLPVGKVAAGMATLALAYAVVVLVWSEPLAALLTGGDFSVERVTIAGYALTAVAASVFLPLGQSMIARRASRSVFNARLIEAVVAVSLALLLLLVVSPSVVPYGEAVGLIVGMLFLYGASRSSHSPGSTEAPRPPD